MFRKVFACLFIFTSVFLLIYESVLAKEHPIDVSAQRAILMEGHSGRVLYGQEIHEKSRIASITKVMTAILAIESGKMNQKVTISEKAEGTEGSSLYLESGQKWLLKNLVYGLMLRSGNDAAVAIAQAVGGSVEGFVHLMNQKAALIGMSDTVFANPHGLDDHKKMYSTAYDMALLTRYAMKNPMFRKIAGTKVYRVHDANGKIIRVWRNKNKMLFLYSYATGGKTGYTQLAHRTLITTAKKNGMQLIAVTLDDSDDWKDQTNLFQWGFEHYHMETLVKEGTVKGIDHPFYKDKVYAEEDLKYPLSKKENAKVSTSMNLYEPPEDGEWKEGQVPSPVGKLFLHVDGKRVAETSLFYQQSPQKKHSFLDQLKHIFLLTVGVRVDD